MENSPVSENLADRRKFVRFDLARPVTYKVCNPETISKLLNGHTQNISQGGILCQFKESLGLDSILWLNFDIDTLNVCKEIERNCIIVQKGILAKVVRVNGSQDGYFDVGMYFLTQEEKEGFLNLCNRLNKEAVSQDNRAHGT